MVAGGWGSNSSASVAERTSLTVTPGASSRFPGTSQLARSPEHALVSEQGGGTVSLGARFDPKPIATRLEHEQPASDKTPDALGYAPPGPTSAGARRDVSVPQAQGTLSARGVSYFVGCPGRAGPKRPANRT
jgi:hypothetical protein